MAVPATECVTREQDPPFLRGPLRYTLTPKLFRYAQFSTESPFGFPLRPETASGHEVGVLVAKEGVHLAGAYKNCDIRLYCSEFDIINYTLYYLMLYSANH